MQLLFLTVLVFSTFVFGKPIDTQYGDAGIIMSMRQKFLTEYKNTFNFKFMQDLQSTYFPQVEKHFQVAMLDIYFRMYDIKIVEARYNPKNTNFAIS